METNTDNDDRELNREQRWVLACVSVRGCQRIIISTAMRSSCLTTVLYCVRKPRAPKKRNFPPRLPIVVYYPGTETVRNQQFSYNITYKYFFDHFMQALILLSVTAHLDVSQRYDALETPSNWKALKTVDEHTRLKLKSILALLTKLYVLHSHTKYITM